MKTTRCNFPSRIADLGFSVALPEGWTTQPLPDETPDFDTPTAMLALALVTAPYAAIVFAFAARPAFSDGTLLDWTTYLLRENGIEPLALGEHAAGDHPAWIGEALQQSELGPMRIRFAFIEDGARLLNITLTSPDALASSVQGAWFEALASFRLETPRGATVPLKAAPSGPDPANIPGACEIAPDPPPPPPPARGEAPQRPSSKARRLEAMNRLDEAEQAMMSEAQNIGACISLAELFRERMIRLREAGDIEGAREARERAIGWAEQYAGHATSGGEGAALSRERDAFIRSLGPSF